MKSVPLVLVAAFLCVSLAMAGEIESSSKILQQGDVVAVCGDSITSNGQYPGFMEGYALMCAPNPQVTFINFGRWGWRAQKFGPTIEKAVLPSKPTVVTFCYGMNTGRGGRVMAEGSVNSWGKIVGGIVETFRKAGVRAFVLGSPGCVDSTHHRAPEAANKNLGMLGDAAKKVAAEKKIRFVDVHNPMIEVMAKAKAKYGKDFPFAGGKGDGVHPQHAGHLVMAWVFLKGLGYDGNLGTITIDLKADTATATGGHKVLTTKADAVELESTRYPFCFYKNKGKLDWRSTKSTVGLFPFNEDLNRLTLIVKGGKDKQTVTWGKASKTFSRADLEKGVNLAAEFMEDNPFKGPFSKIMVAMADRNKMNRLLSSPKHKDNAGFKKRLERALENMKVQPVKHTLTVAD